MPQPAARTAVLVEGVSDQRAVETLARRRGLDLDAAGIEVVAIGGAQAIRGSLERFGPRGLGLRLAGLCDVGEEAYVRRALEQAGLGADLTRAGMEALGFFVCVADLEDELIRVLGPARVEEIVESEGELGAFRTLQKQPEWRERDTHDQLRRFMGSGGSRKIRYASLLVDALDLAHVPRPLDGLVSRVGAPGLRRAETRRAGSSSDR
jgi:OLD-like protein